MKERIERIIRESASLKTSLLGMTDVMEKLAMRMSSVLRAGGVIYLFGNGGSAADAQHIAAELSGRFTLERKPLPAVALTTNASSLTAIANDYGYEQVFSRQLEGLINTGDLAVGISTSGRSKNVVEGLRVARLHGAVTVAFVGEYTDDVAEFCDIVVSVPSKDTARIQECHILIGHIICELIEKSLFG